MIVVVCLMKDAAKQWVQRHSMSSKRGENRKKLHANCKAKLRILRTEVFRIICPQKEEKIRKKNHPNC